MERQNELHSQSSSNISLNDSDDSAFIFKSPLHKRKLKPVSPRTKRRKLTQNNELSQSAIATRQKSSTSKNKPPMNKSVPILSLRPDKKSKSTALTTIESSATKNNKLDEEKEKLPLKDKIDANQKSQPRLHATSEIIQTNQSGYFSMSKSKEKFGGKESLACPLCHKNFDNSSSHVSHMKQCAKKKKISLTHLVRTIEGKVGNETKVPDKVVARTIKKLEEQSESSHTTFDLAVAAAMSLSLTETSAVPELLAVDKKVIDSQKSTLEKFGFTTSSAIPGTSRRRKNAIRPSNSVLQSRTAEERMRLLTEKAAVILLANEDNPPPNDIEHSSRRTSGLNDQLPYETEEPKLWQLGQCSEGGPWYLEDLKEHIVPSNSEMKCQDMTSSPVQSKNIDESWEKAKEQEVTEVALDHQCRQSENMEIYGENAEKREVAEVTFDCPPSTLAEDWAMLVGNSQWSDKCIETCDGKVPIHTLVLKTRCPGVEISDLLGSCLKIPSSVLLIVLRFVYTGKVDKMLLSDLKSVKNLAQLFHLPDLVACLTTPKNTTSGSTSSNDVIPSSISPKNHYDWLTSGGFPVDINSPNVVDEKGAANYEADTVPVTRQCLNFTENEELPLEIPERVEDSEVVDLTQSGGGSPGSCELDPFDRNYWSMIRHELDEESRADKEEEEDRWEHAEELAKIQCFIDKRRIESKNRENLELVEHNEEDRREMEKIYNMSRSSNSVEADLFADHEEVQVVSNQAKISDEIILVSSDSEGSANFELSTDEEVTAASRPKEENLPDEVHEIPFFDSPECDSFIDYRKESSLPSQSLVAAVVSPRTPRKVLGSPYKPAVATSVLSCSLHEELVTKIDSTVALEEPEATCFSGPPSSVQEHKASEVRTGSLRKRRRSTAQVTGSKIVRRSIRSLNERGDWRARVNILAEKTAMRKAMDEEPLSTSILTALDETWKGDGSPPINPRNLIEPQFIEITPRATPSVKVIDKVTPRPNYSAMKTVSLKKHLQKFGLKQSLGKVKARKILRHIYDEMHPMVNTKTGKVVKMLPYGKNTTNSKRRNKKSNSRAVKPSGSKGKRSGKVVKDPLKDVDNFSNTNGDAVVDEEDVNSCDADTASLSDLSCEDEYNGVEDEILTQCPNPAISLDATISKYILDNPDVHRRILSYEPLWVEAFRIDIYDAVKVKFKISDVMEFLDRKCITYRSELQAANSKKRNDRKKERCSKKKEKIKNALLSIPT